MKKKERKEGRKEGREREGEKEKKEGRKEDTLCFKCARYNTGTRVPVGCVCRLSFKKYCFLFGSVIRDFKLP